MFMIFCHKMILNGEHPAPQRLLFFFLWPFSQIHQMLDKMFDVHPAGTSIFIAAFVFENDCVTFRG